MLVICGSRIRKNSGLAQFGVELPEFLRIRLQIDAVASRLKCYGNFFLVFCVAWFWPACVSAAELGSQIKTLSSVGPRGAGNEQAARAWQQLSQADVSALPPLLESLDRANPLAANWIRGAIDTIAQRQLDRGQKLPAAELEQFVRDAKHAARARRLAFEWLVRADRTARQRLIPTMLHDLSAELRHDAVAHFIARADAAEQEAAKRSLLKRSFAAAVDEDQVNLLAGKLKQLGETVDLARHYGFLMRWHLVGPFDNTGKKGFDIAYPPETKLDPATKYEGKLKGKPVRWIEHVTSHDHGKVDLNKVLGKHMGAIAYCLSRFQSDRRQSVEFRTSSHNAIKLWLNGKLIDQRQVYHSGGEMDQYVSRGVMRKGPNTVLLKVCQNEQTLLWAQMWEFQLRVCDPAGAAILSIDRP